MQSAVSQLTTRRLKPFAFLEVLVSDGPVLQFAALENPEPHRSAELDLSNTITFNKMHLTWWPSNEWSKRERHSSKPAFPPVT
jgi:hypothetical protein